LLSTFNKVVIKVSILFCCYCYDAVVFTAIIISLQALTAHTAPKSCIDLALLRGCSTGVDLSDAVELLPSSQYCFCTIKKTLGSEE